MDLVSEGIQQGRKNRDKSQHVGGTMTQQYRIKYHHLDCRFNEGFSIAIRERLCDQEDVVSKSKRQALLQDKGRDGGWWGKLQEACGQRLIGTGQVMKGSLGAFMENHQDT